MNRTLASAQILRAAPLALLMLVTACAKAPDAGLNAEDNSAIPPALIPPSEVADPAEQPSYEVGIATAAADRNHAKAKCAEMPEAERATCEEAADATFATAEADLDDLRGNQQ